MRKRERYGSTALNFPDRRYVFIPPELGALKSEIYSKRRQSFLDNKEIKMVGELQGKDTKRARVYVYAREGTELFGIFDPCIIRR